MCRGICRRGTATDPPAVGDPCQVHPPAPACVMAKRRRRQRRRRQSAVLPRPVVPAPIPTLDTEAVGARIDECFADAERLIERTEQNAARAGQARVGNDIAAALRAMDRRISIAESGDLLAAPGIFARAKMRVVRWRQARRHRRLLAKFDRAIARRDTHVADHSSPRYWLCSPNASQGSTQPQ